MAVVRLRAPLSELAGGRRELELDGATVRDVLRALEREHPAIAGWILDEQVSIREHVNVFVNGENESRGHGHERRRPHPRDPLYQRRLSRHDRSFSSERRRGCSRSRATAARSRSRPARSPASRSSSRSATRAAAATSRASRPRSTGRRSSSPTTPPASGSRRRGWRCPKGRRSRSSACGRSCPARRKASSTPGGAPGVLFESRDGGTTWELNESFWNQPTRPDWSPGAGGMCLHSIATWPGDPQRLALAISAVGVWLSDDGGQTWRHGNKGLVPALHAGGEARGHASTSASTTCTATRSGRSGCSCSSTAACTARTTPGESWESIAEGLPSDFGFPMVVDPDDPDSAYVIPLVGRPGPGDARRARPRLRDARRRRELDRRAATASRRRTRTSRSCARPSRATGPGRAWASTSARRRATCSARQTPARPGSRPRRSSRPCTRFASPSPRSAGRRSDRDRCAVALQGFRAFGICARRSRTCADQSNPRDSIRIGVMRTVTRRSSGLCQG